MTPARRLRDAATPEQQVPLYVEWADEERRGAPRWGVNQTARAERLGFALDRYRQAAELSPLAKHITVRLACTYEDLLKVPEDSRRSQAGRLTAARRPVVVGISTLRSQRERAVKAYLDLYWDDPEQPSHEVLERDLTDLLEAAEVRAQPAAERQRLLMTPRETSVWQRALQRGLAVDLRALCACLTEAPPCSHAAAGAWALQVVLGGVDTRLRAASPEHGDLFTLFGAVTPKYFLAAAVPVPDWCQAIYDQEAAKVSELLAQGAIPQDDPAAQRALLRLAAWQSNNTLIEGLLKYLQADLNDVELNRDMSLVQLIVCQPGSGQLAKLQLCAAQGVNFVWHPPQTVSPFRLALRGRGEAANFYIENIALEEKNPHDGRTPIIEALREKDSAAAIALLLRGADTSAIDETVAPVAIGAESDPLHKWTVFARHYEILRADVLPWLGIYEEEQKFAQMALIARVCAERHLPPTKRLERLARTLIHIAHAVPEKPNLELSWCVCRKLIEFSTIDGDWLAVAACLSSLSLIKKAFQPGLKRFRAADVLPLARVLKDHLRAGYSAPMHAVVTKMATQAAGLLHTVNTVQKPKAIAFIAHLAEFVDVAPLPTWEKGYEALHRAISVYGWEEELNFTMMLFARAHSDDDDNNLLRDGDDVLALCGESGGAKNTLVRILERVRPNVVLSLKQQLRQEEIADLRERLTLQRKVQRARDNLHKVALAERAAQARTSSRTQAWLADAAARIKVPRFAEAAPPRPASDPPALRARAAVSSPEADGTQGQVAGVASAAAADDAPQGAADGASQGAADAAPQGVADAAPQGPLGAAADATADAPPAPPVTAPRVAVSRPGAAQPAAPSAADNPFAGFFQGTRRPPAPPMPLPEHLRATFAAASESLELLAMAAVPQQGPWINFGLGASARLSLAAQASPSASAQPQDFAGHCRVLGDLFADEDVRGGLSGPKCAAAFVALLARLLGEGPAIELLGAGERRPHIWRMLRKLCHPDTRVAKARQRNDNDAALQDMAKAEGDAMIHLLADLEACLREAADPQLHPTRYKALIAAAQSRAARAPR